MNKEDIEDAKVKPIKYEWFYKLKTYIQIIIYRLKYR